MTRDEIAGLQVSATAVHAARLDEEAAASRIADERRIKDQEAMDPTKVLYLIEFSFFAFLPLIFLWRAQNILCFIRIRRFWIPIH